MWLSSPAFIVIKAADEFKRQDHGSQPAVADRREMKTAEGWDPGNKYGVHLPEGHQLGLVLPVHGASMTSRATSSPGSCCTTMKAGDVTDTLTMALQARGA